MASRYERFTRAFRSGLQPFDEPGEKIDVQPFAPGEVTTGAGVLRALTAIAAARRGRANYLAAERERNEGRRYRDAQIALIESKLNAPDYEQQRIDQAAENAADLDTYRTGMLGEAKRRNDILSARGGKGSGAAKLTPAGAKMALEVLVKQGERYADEELGARRLGTGGKQYLSIDEYGQKLARGLRSPVASQRAYAARALGVAPLTIPGDVVENGYLTGKKQSRVVFDESGLPAYDQKAIDAALAAWLAKRRTGLVGQWRTMNSDRLSAYEAAAMGLGLGEVEVPPDELEEAALEFAGTE